MFQTHIKIIYIADYNYNLKYKDDKRMNPELMELNCHSRSHLLSVTFSGLGRSSDQSQP